MEPIKKILYVSCLRSSHIIERIFTTSVSKPALSVQKFHRLLVDGLVMHDGSCSVQTLGSIPVTPACHKKRICNLPSETVGNIRYNYAPMINMPVVKNIRVFILLMIANSRLYAGK